MTTRLTTAAPEVQRMLDAFDESERLAIAHVVVPAVISRVSNLPEAVSSALDAADVLRAAAISDALDQRYFELDEAGAPEGIDVFCQARAAMAVRFLLEKSPLEALYEAAIAMDNPGELLRLVREAARGAI